MNRLFRSNSLVSSRSSSTILAPIPDANSVINKEEIELQNDEKIDSSWNISKMPIKEINKTTFLQGHLLKLISM